MATPGGPAPQQIVQIPAKEGVPVNQQPQKVQYVYKQGGQTIVIDAPPPQTSQNSAVGAASTSSNQTVRLVLPAGTAAQPSAAAKPSVDSIANSLISQIQTPLTPNAQGTLVRTVSAPAVQQHIQQVWPL